MPIRVLLVESDPDTLLFLQDVLTDLEGSAHWTHWTSLEPIFAGDWRQAAGHLDAADSGKEFDVAIVATKLPDCEGAEVFRRFQEIAAHVPLIVLADEEERSSAERLLREGAQDVLLKNQIDCAPLAHAIRGAIERHRLLKATRSLTMIDPQSGLMTSAAFLEAVERDRELARHHGRRMLFIILEPMKSDPIPSTGQQATENHMALLRMVETLRGLAGPLDQTGWLGPQRLGLAILETPSTPLDQRRDQLRRQAEPQGLRVGAAMFDVENPVSLEALLESAEADLAQLRATATASAK